MSETTIKSLPKINGFTLHRPNLLPVLVFIGLIFTVSLFYVWSRVQVTGLEYEISNAEGSLRDLRHELSSLRLEAASLRSPERIERVAREELKLRLPTAEQVVTVN